MPKVLVSTTIASKVLPTVSPDEYSKENLDMLRGALKGMLSMAIADAPDLASIDTNDPTGVEAFSLSFPKVEDRYVRQQAKALKVKEVEVCARLLFHAEKKEYYNQYITVTDPVWDKYLAATGRKERQHQTRAFEYTKDALINGKVGMIEASTGVGKTAMMIGSANHIAIERDTNVVIATPTINLIKHFAAEYHSSDPVILEKKAKLNVILGMSSFVSVARLEILINEPQYSEYYDRVKKWLDEKGAPIGGFEALGHHYLLECLLYLAPNIPIKAITLSPYDHDDLAMTEYWSQFEFEPEPCITLCTHSMLAIDIKTRLVKESHNEEVITIKEKLQTLIDTTEEPDERIVLLQEMEAQIRGVTDSLDIGKIPYWKYLIIDEAHQLEENIANTMSDSISLWSIHRTASYLSSNGHMPQTSYRRIDKAWKKLINLENGKDGYLNVEGSDLRVVDIIKDIFSPIMSMKSNTSNPDVGRLKSQAKFVFNSLTNKYQNLVHISFSPVRNLPNISIGNRSNARTLRRLWGLSTGAACVSATLYNKKKDLDSAVHFRNILSIPMERYKEYTPITPAWTKNIQSFNIVSPDEEPTWLKPPTRSDRLQPKEYELAEQDWCESVTKQLLEIFEQAQGGVLVLLTSYKAIDIIVPLLKKHIPHVIHPDGNTTLNMQKKGFMELGKNNIKSIWLAVGGAWTGLDVNGADIDIIAKEDNLMTDLVIPKLPFGTNRTISHDMRRQHSINGSTIEVTETSIRFKQGLGRLIRREGLPCNRNIWVLDARLNEPRLNGFVFSIKELIQTYRPIKLIKKNH